MNETAHIPGFSLHKEIGRGGMAVVYLATQTSLDRKVAIKIMSSALAADASFSERFLHEAKTAARLQHAGIVSVYDTGISSNNHYIVIEYIPGGDLGDRLKAGPLTEIEALEITKQLAAALDYAHKKNFVHRDVKPDNILFRESGAVVLTDFGIAKAMGNANTGLTAAGVAIGTPRYMSPEQARGHPVDGRSDLYSLGVVFHQMLTGNLPYEAPDSFAVGLMHISEPIPTLPENLSQYQSLLNKLMAKSPEDRFQTGQELVNTIRELLQHPQDTKTRKGARTHKRKRNTAKRENKPEARPEATRAMPKVTAETKPISTQPPRHQKQQRNSRFSGYLALAIFGVTAGILLFVFFDRDTSVERYAQKPATSEVEAIEAHSSTELDDHPSPSLADALDTSDEPKSIPGQPTPETQPTNETTSGELTPSTREEAEPKPELTISAAVVAEQKRAISESNKMSEAPAATSPELGSTPAYPSGTDDLASSIQIELRRLGRNVSVDGVIGPESQRHIRDFQRKKGQFVTGEKSIGLLADLKASTVWPALPSGTAFADCPVCPELVIVPAGEFTMGSPATEAGRDTSEGPVRLVIVSAFALATTAVTFDQWDACHREGGCQRRPGDQGWGRDQRPVVHVSHDDALEYLNWLHEKTGHQWRLPSEAEWEYAARASSTARFHTGNCITSSDANIDGSRPPDGCAAGEYRPQTLPVASFEPNAWGLFDMHGNVWEWTADCWNSNYHNASSSAEPAQSGDCSRAAVRGGAWYGAANNARSAKRNPLPRDRRLNIVGFRPARDI